jgi:hypothetical protein
VALGNVVIGEGRRRQVEEVIRKPVTLPGALFVSC